MTEHFGFFDAIQDSNGHYDREYNAQQWTEPFRALVTTGVMKGAYNQLEVTANGSNMTSSVKSGIAFIEGRFYFNDALVDLIHDTEVMGLSRIDRIVVRMDSRTEARHVKTFIKKGVPSTNPVVPTLTQTPAVYEISLAQVRVVGGQTYIASNAITDERGKDAICPWAGSKILPNFNNDELEELVNNVANLNTSVTNVSNNLVLKANKKQENWIDIVLVGGTADTTNKPQYFKDEFGFVHVAGKVSGTFLAWQMPVGYRPEKPFSIPLFVGKVFSGSLAIQTNGYFAAAPSQDNHYEFNFSYKASEV